MNKWKKMEQVEEELKDDGGGGRWVLERKMDDGEEE